MRKNKGRLTYYLEMIDEKYHFEKKSAAIQRSTQKEKPKQQRER